MDLISQIEEIEKIVLVGLGYPLHLADKTVTRSNQPGIDFQSNIAFKIYEYDKMTLEFWNSMDNEDPP